jgi:hypothetical protein
VTRRTGRLARLREEARQRRHHRAFRIGPPVWVGPAREELERLLAAVAEAAPPGPADGTPPSAETEQPPAETEMTSTQFVPGLDEASLADAATQLWRAQRRLDREPPSARSRQTGRYLRACRTALADAGLVVQDHDGDAFHPGRSLEALAFQDDPSLTAETIVETVRPTVYLRERRIRTGQVIVGRPATGDGAADPGGDVRTVPHHERTDHA